MRPNQSGRPTVQERVRNRLQGRDRGDSECSFDEARSQPASSAAETRTGHSRGDGEGKAGQRGEPHRDVCMRCVGSGRACTEGPSNGETKGPRRRAVRGANGARGRANEAAPAEPGECVRGKPRGKHELAITGRNHQRGRQSIKKGRRPRRRRGGGEGREPAATTGRER